MEPCNSVAGSAINLNSVCGIDRPVFFHLAVFPLSVVLRSAFGNVNPGTVRLPVMESANIVVAVGGVVGALPAHHLLNEVAFITVAVIEMKRPPAMRMAVHKFTDVTVASRKVVNPVTVRLVGLHRAGVKVAIGKAKGGSFPNGRDDRGCGRRQRFLCGAWTVRRFPAGGLVG